MQDSSASSFTQQDQRNLRCADAGANPAEATRNRRMSRQAAARSILGGPDGVWPVCKCGRYLIDPKKGARAVVNVASGQPTARFDGVMKCGSIWTCPACSSTTSHLRTLELRSAAKCWEKAGNCLLALTLTIPHGKHDSLTELQSCILSAMTTFRGYSGYKELIKQWQVKGQVRAEEVLYGETNGWHPHFHMLWFSLSEPNAWEIGEIQQEIARLWANACESNGLRRPLPFCITVRKGSTTVEKVAAYLAKYGREPVKSPWGAEQETVQWQHKTYEKGPYGALFSPFALLDEYAISRDINIARRFLEYATVFRGARQLVWSRGFRAYLGQFGFVALADDDKKANARAERDLEDSISYAIAESDYKLLVKFDLINTFLALLESIVLSEQDSVSRMRVKCDRFLRELHSVNYADSRKFARFACEDDPPQPPPKGTTAAYAARDNE